MSTRRKRRGGALLPEAARQNAVPRRLRVENALFEGLMTALGDLRDPRIVGATVMRVELSDDLRFARVFVRALGKVEEDERRGLIRALGAAAGRLRGQVGRDLELRFAPELRFVYDDGAEAAERVDELLAEIARESQSSSED
jgi:ribosome-binding factor A